jgi:UDP-glucose:(heptosyl)LPS alpha-1,3-glucosyltransferase
MSEDNNPATRKKLKIAVLVRNFVTTGGAERYACQVSHRLAAEHEVHIFCQTWDPALTAGLTIHKLPGPCKPSFLNQLLFSWSCNRAVDQSFDLLYSHERVSRFDVLSIHCHCYRGFLTRSRGWHKPLRWLGELTSPRGLAYLWLEKNQYSDKPGRLLIADSQMTVKDVLENYPKLSAERLTVAHPGVDLEEIDRAAAAVDREGLRRRYGLAPADFALLFVGTEFKRKGLDALLEGLSLARCKTARLLVAGAGDLPTYLRLAEHLGLADRVTFLGRISDIYPLYLLADAFILPTLDDPCPIAPLEAMSCGTATIMSNVPWCGTAEHIRHDEAVLLRNPRDANEIAQVIDRLADPAVRRGYAKRGRALGRTLGWEHTTRITLETFDRVMAERE